MQDKNVKYQTPNIERQGESRLRIFVAHFSIRHDAMKIVIALMIICTQARGQEAELLTRGDSLIIRATNITNDPFGFEPNSLGRLGTFQPEVMKKPVKNY